MCIFVSYGLECLHYAGLYIQTFKSVGMLHLKAPDSIWTCFATCEPVTNIEVILHLV